MKDRLPDDARRIRGAYNRAELEHTQAKILRETALETTEPKNYRATFAGDARKLRGIPAIGRGVSGAINGTLPHGVR